MNLMSFFSRRTTAPVARDRLQILLAHERGVVGGKSDLVALLREEILTAISRHVPIERDKVQIKLDRGNAISILEIEVEVPSAGASASASAGTPSVAINA